jgi:hypothetical protein
MLRDVVLLAHRPNVPGRLRCLQNRDDLLFREPRSLHLAPSSFPEKLTQRLDPSSQG